VRARSPPDREQKENEMADKTLVFKTKNGGAWHITCRALTGQLNDLTLERLAKKGIHLPDNAPLREKKALSVELVKAVAEKIEFTDKDGNDRVVTDKEKSVLLGFDNVSAAIIKRGVELNEDIENELELVSGNSEEPSAS
jgi:hypothetical protein